MVFIYLSILTRGFDWTLRSYECLILIRLLWSDTDPIFGKAWIRSEHSDPKKYRGTDLDPVDINPDPKLCLKSYNGVFTI